jgi:Domain of unknown function (DUF4861)
MRGLGQKNGCGLLRLFCAGLVAGLALDAHVSIGQQIELINPLDVVRTQEVVEVPLTHILKVMHISLSQGSSLIATDAATGERIPDQIFSSQGNDTPDQLLLLLTLSPKSKRRIALKVDAAAPKLKPLVFGREAQERKDDFAWENEYVTYRVYGPALEATGEIASGIDVWSKRVPNFVIDSFYQRDHEGALTHNPSLSYHKDNGVGLDSYLVGPTRGCGGTGVLIDEKLYVSKNYTTKRILSDGPIRFAFEVTYAPWDANGVSVTETKQITLDAGSHLNKIVSTYTFTGKETLPLAAGIAIHEGAKAEFPVADEVASVWDTPQDASAGRIATGLVAAATEHGKTTLSGGNALMVFTRHSGEAFTYYAGSGWSKADMPSAADWNAYLKSTLDRLEHPITLRWIEK